MFGKKAFIHHPIVWMLIAFLLGMLIMYLIAKGVLPVSFLSPCKAA